MRGRKPKPLVLRVLEGNPGKRKIPNAPNFAGSFGPPPRWLGKIGTGLWRQLAPELEAQRLAAPQYRTVFLALCANYERAVSATRAIQRHGATYKSTSGTHRRRPEVGIAAQAWTLVGRFCVEFGLTPSAVGRINLPQGSERSLEEIVNARKYFGES